jgi:tRNA threonylcarbamoyl adenosine modification protein YjeE
MTVLGIAKESAFSSPTFTILTQYAARALLVNHVDLYRLERFEGLVQLDLLAEFGRPGTLTLVEWGDKFSELVPFYTLRLHFDFDASDPLVRIIRTEGAK